MQRRRGREGAFASPGPRWHAEHYEVRRRCQDQPRLPPVSCHTRLSGAQGEAYGVPEAMWCSGGPRPFFRHPGGKGPGGNDVSEPAAPPPPRPRRSRRDRRPRLSPVRPPHPPWGLAPGDRVQVRFRVMVEDGVRIRVRTIATLTRAPPRARPSFQKLEGSGT